MKTSFSYKFYSTTQSAWAAMEAEIKKAQHSIYWEVYILKDDIIGNKFIDLLVEKANEGVQIKIILDAFGSFHLSTLTEGRMIGAGIEVLWFNRLSPKADFKDWFRRILKRNHRKVLVIDEKVAFVGGVNIHVESKEWDDINLRLRGKVVRSFLYGFAKTYIKSGGNKKNVKHILHPKLTMLDKEIEPIEYNMYSPSQKIKRSHLRKFYLSALGAAKETFTLITPYYVPDKKFLEMVAKAHKRGVKVNIMLPARSDHKLMGYLAQTFYDLTTRAGAKMYFLKNMNHGKAFSVDGKIGMVGSPNLNSRSWFIDEESGVTFSDNKMVGELNNILFDWKGMACELDLGKNKKNLKRKFGEWFIKKFKDYV